MFAGLAEVTGAGVTMRAGIEVSASRQDEPWWRSAVPPLDHVPPPAGYGDAWTFVAPVVEMPRLPRAGWPAGSRSSAARSPGSTSSALPVGPDVVVNCSGLGSRLLAADPTVTPVRGQVVLVRQVGLERWFLESADPPTYVVPRAHDIVVGGTERGG